MDIKVYNLDGKAAGEMKVSDAVFNVEPNATLLHETLNAMLSNKRQVLANTKTKGEVRGGGKKPWKQKGTGRARHGSSRSPLWVGGGVTFGPRRERNYEVKINKQVKDRALCMILSDKIKNNELLVVEKVVLKTAKTKELFVVVKGFLKKLGKDLVGMNLLITAKNEALKTAGRNLANVENMGAADLNVLNATKSKLMIVEKEALQDLEKRLTK
jgi:large subunit ribosomal protein L4